MNAVVVSGRQGSGKSDTAKAICRYFGLKRIVDGWAYGDPLEDGDLALTNEVVPASMMQHVCVVDLDTRHIGVDEHNRIVSEAPGEFLCVLCGAWNLLCDGNPDKQGRFEGAESMCNECYRGANDQLNAELMGLTDVEVAS